MLSQEFNVEMPCDVKGLEPAATRHGAVTSRTFVCSGS